MASSATQSSGTLDANYTVLTPEYVEFDFVLAGLYSRFLAWLVDQALVLTVTFVVLSTLSALMVAFPGFGSALSVLVWFLIDWGYGITLETVLSGQTVGKKLLGLRVLQESGVRVGFYHAAIRNLARPLDRLPLLYLVGGTAAALSSCQQRFGDMLAGTIVIRERRLRLPASLARAEAETSLLADPQFQSRVKKLTAAEREVVLSAALRREELQLEARLQLFASLCLHLQEQVDLYKPPHLSDEKLVLLVAAALAQGRPSTSPLLRTTSTR